LGLRESPGGDQPYDAATHDTNVKGLGELCVAFKIKKQVGTRSAGIGWDGPGLALALWSGAISQAPRSHCLTADQCYGG
jgi:hypothetical protein